MIPWTVCLYSEIIVLKNGSVVDTSKPKSVKAAIRDFFD